MLVAPSLIMANDQQRCGMLPIICNGNAAYKYGGQYYIYIYCPPYRVTSNGTAASIPPFRHRAPCRGTFVHRATATEKAVPAAYLFVRNGGMHTCEEKRKTILYSRRRGGMVLIIFLFRGRRETRFFFFFFVTFPWF